MFTPVGKAIARSRGKWTDVVSLKVGQKLAVWVVGDEPLALPVHFYKRSYLCSADGECPFCQVGMGRQHMLFVGVIHERRVKILRMAYNDGLCRSMGYGVTADVSLLKRGSSYDVQPFVLSREPTVRIRSVELLERVLQLHKLHGVPIGDEVVADVWERMAPAIAKSGAVAAQRWAQEKS